MFSSFRVPTSPWRQKQKDAIMNPDNHSGLLASPDRSPYRTNITRSHSLTPRYAQSTNTLTFPRAQQVEVEVERKAKGNQSDDFLRSFPILSVDNQTTHEIDELQGSPHISSQTFPSFTLSNSFQREDNQSDSHLQSVRVEISLKERQRGNAIRELFTTEKVYIRDLCVLHDFYIVPMLKQRHPVMEDAQIAVFFSHLTQLITLHRKLFHDLEEMINIQGYTQAPSSIALLHSTSKHLTCEGIGAVFCRFTGLFTFHAAYAKDYETVTKLLQRYRNDVKLGFSLFLQKCKDASRSSQSFDSLLIMPIQRIPRYKLLLQRVCDYTPSEDSDAWFLAEAVKRVEEATTKMNATVAAQADLEMILATQKLFQGQISLITANRKLIKTGNLVKATKHQQTKKVVVHLFNDILLCSDHAGTGGLRVRSILELVQPTLQVDVELSPAFAGSTNALARNGCKQSCAFTIKSSQKNLLLFASSPHHRKEWTEQLQGAINGARLLRTKVTADSSQDPVALLPDQQVKSCTFCKNIYSIQSQSHRCHRCALTVCDTCSKYSCITLNTTYDIDAKIQCGASPNERSRDYPKERMCNQCYRAIEAVKKAATRWKSLIIKRRGILRRYGEHGCNEFFFEIRPHILKQYTLESASRTTSKEYMCSLDLDGAIVIHRDTQESQHGFQIIKPNNEAAQKHFDDSITDNMESEENIYAYRASSTQYSEAESFHGDFICDQNCRSDSEQICYEGDEWIRSASDAEQESGWTTAIQDAADKSVVNARDHQDADVSLLPDVSSPPCFDSVFSKESDQEHRDIESIDIKPSDENLDACTSHEGCSHIEAKRLDILTKIIRTEEWYITCLEECIHIYVQPLLLRQLEAQKCLREERQKKTKRAAYASHGERIYSQIEKSGSSKSTSIQNESCMQSPLTPNCRPKPLGLIKSTIFQHRNHSTVKTPFFSGSGSTCKQKKAARSGSLNGTAGCVRPQERVKCKSTSSIREVEQDDCESSTSYEWNPQLRKAPLLNAAMAVFFSSVNHICTLNQQLLNHLSRHVSETRAMPISDRLFRPV